MKPTDTPPDIQGEGNYDATRRYDEAARDFAQSGQVDAAARKARPSSPEEADALRRAEEAGKSHSKGEAPRPAQPMKPGKPAKPTKP